MPQRQAGDIGATYQDAPTKSINVGGTRFVYRRLGADAGVPVIFLHHLGAVLDNWDPRVLPTVSRYRQSAPMDLSPHRRTSRLQVATRRRIPQTGADTATRTPEPQVRQELRRTTALHHRP